MTTPQDQPLSDWLSEIGRNRQPVGVGLIVIGAILAVLALVLTVTLTGLWGPAAFTCFVLGVGCVAAGLWFYLSRPEALIPSEAGRIVVLIVGGWWGFSLTQHMLRLGWYWRETVFGGLEGWQGPNGWRVWLVLSGTLAGLAIMFASLLLGRSEEQSSQTLRRIIYGYNAFLTAFLLFIILVIVNVISYQYVPAQTDYTDLKIYTLNPRSETILKGLANDKPVKVYVLLDSLESGYMNDINSLEDNCRNVTDQIRFENIVRDANIAKVAKLTRDYKLVDDMGMLVVYGTEDQSSSTFIKLETLYQRGPKQMTFRGENELMSAILFLQENKTKPILYFTQANGELDLGAGDERNPLRRIAALKERLGKDNYDVHALKLGVAAEKTDPSGAVTASQVPDDAAAVIIASPRTPFSEQALNALDAYMNPKDPSKKKGKLIVLMDPVRPAEGASTTTGLEPFLAKFSVEVGNNRILDIDGEPPQQVVALANPALRDSNPVAAALEGVPLALFDARTVQRGGSERPPVPQNYQPAELLIVVPSRGQLVFAETNLDADPSAVVQEVRTEFQKGNREKLAAKKPTRQLPVALAVSEGGFSPMMDPHAPPPPSTPRLLVFGNAGFISDAQLRRSANYDVLASSLAWLRERPNSIGLDPKERKEYQMDANVNLSRMTILPLGLMVVAVFGLGLGIWVVRRR